YPGPLAVREQREPPTQAHQIACGVIVPVHCATTSVPIPLLVNSSTSTECGTRPSMIAAASTPPSTASRQARIFGIIPDSSDGSSSVSAAVVMCETSDSRLGQSAYSPGTSVRMTSLRAPSAVASAAAAASALTLRD